MNTEAIQLMLIDVCQELIEKARLSKAEVERSGSDYDKGRNFTMYEVISLLTEQADAFGVDKTTIGLGGIDPERDLL